LFTVLALAEMVLYDNVSTLLCYYLENFGLQMYLFVLIFQIFQKKM
jgi:hypothetical protein